MIKLKIIISIITLIVFFLYSCRSMRETHLMDNAFKYQFSKEDSVYINAFKSNDSLSLQQYCNISYFLSLDSLIVKKKRNTMKYYSEYFEVYEYLTVTDLNVYKYEYSGKIISITRYYNGSLEYRKINVEGKLHLKRNVLKMPSF